MTLVPLLALCACGDLPRPFMGQPGALGARLAQPPPARLAIVAPTQALLANDAAQGLATAVAAALADQGVPAMAANAKKGDWSVATTAVVKGNDVVPTFTVFNPAGGSKGSTDGPPVPAADWAAGDPATLHREAEAAAPAVVKLLTDITAAIQLSDPNSLVNRQARIQFLGVTGAPGDGNQSLATRIRTALTRLNLTVQDSAKDADYSLRCVVKTSPGPENSMVVEITWIVDSGAGEQGRISQINAVPPNALTPYWGDVAVVVADQAADGVREVILNQTAAHRLAGDKPPAATKPAADSAAPAVAPAAKP